MALCRFVLNSFAAGFVLYRLAVRAHPSMALEGPTGRPGE